jgi:exopolysaccharide biosynthesis polyprenyl glycosylphosphotransferase
VIDRSLPAVAPRRGLAARLRGHSSAGSRHARRDPLRRRVLALADAAAALFAVGAFAFLGGGLEAAAWAALFVPLWILLAKLYGLYDRDHRALRHLTADELPIIIAWALTGTAATTVLLLVTPMASLELHTALGAWIVAALAAVVLRASARSCWRLLVPPEQVVVVGRGALARATRRKFDLFPDMHVRVRREVPESALGEIDGEPQWLDGIDRVVLASQEIGEELLADLLVLCKRRDVRLSVVPPARGMFGTAVQLNHVADLPVVEYNTWDVSRSTLLLKRSFDVGVSLALLLLLAPVLTVAALGVRLTSGSPVLFRQTRVGAKGRTFTIYKLRTMAPDAEERLSNVVPLDELREPVFKLRGDPRTTRLGRLLRRWSIDELPQLWNVLKGEMSLVGPRPEQVELVRLYRPEHRFRLDVRPGMTGPMQVYGRGELTFDERLAVERDYIENLTLGRDLRILALTLPVVFRGGGAF